MRCTPMRQALAAGVLALTAAGSAAAQTPSQTPAAPAKPAAATSSTDTRPATTTFLGDTGLWSVPTAEVLPDRKWSVSAYRVNFDDNQGFSDVSQWPLTFSVRLKDRAEVFGAWTLVSRVDRDIRPLFLQTVPGAGGTVPTSPLMADTWSGNKLGDFWIGAKFNLLTQYNQQSPVAFALRPMLKLPTG